MKTEIKYHVSPQLELDFRLVVSEMTGLSHEKINALSWSSQHEDEIESKVNIDFEYNNQDYVHSLHNVKELREWLTNVL